VTRSTAHVEYAARAEERLAEDVLRHVALPAGVEALRRTDDPLTGDLYGPGFLGGAQNATGAYFVGKPDPPKNQLSTA
jgi:hypothetical protein